MSKRVMYDDNGLFLRFVNGLEKRGFDLDIVARNWVYCGNNRDEKGKLAFKIFFPDKELPERASHCICETRIMFNYYITDGNENILVIGSECIRHFLDFNMGRICSHCKGPHKNRKDNYCNSCRKLPSCSGCGRKGKSFCDECRQKQEERILKSKMTCLCGNAKDIISPCCYKCRIKKAEEELKQLKCKCGKTKKKEYQFCYECALEMDDSKCACGKKKKQEYPRCYACQQARNNKYKEIHGR